MIEFKDFSIISWNVRGFASKRSNRHMHELISGYKLDLIFLYETHTNSAKSKMFWEREGYMFIAIEEANGHSGGIWAMASLACHAQFQVHMPQCITIKISRGSAFWHCSGVYASPTYSVRNNLWTFLGNLRANITSSWIMIWDFNEILSPLEQRGGNFCSTRAERFQLVFIIMI